uniref:Lupus la ribonucleoprotein n=1 Tax=Spirometra erinaceieuropaei TaxID=99802 RepID=K7X7N1_SPIER|nr:lupus la ribonucleoprotein [Spirometra erinaceieuropaei]
MMEVVGGSVGDAGSRHSAPKPIKNPWVRGGQSPDSEPVEAFSNHQPTNECASSPPGDDLSSKILRQIEFYFSDANILKGQFMLKSVKASKEGWMKLSTVAAFKRIVSLTTNEQDVRDALKNSSQVEVSDDGTLIRRKNPLPAWDRLVYTRTIMISSFSQGEVVSVDSITALFEVITQTRQIRLRRKLRRRRKNEKRRTRSRQRHQNDHRSLLPDLAVREVKLH